MTCGCTPKLPSIRASLCGESPRQGDPGTASSKRNTPEVPMRVIRSPSLVRSGRQARKSTNNWSSSISATVPPRKGWKRNKVEAKRCLKLSRTARDSDFWGVVPCVIWLNSNHPASLDNFGPHPKADARKSRRAYDLTHAFAGVVQLPDCKERYAPLR